MELFNQILIKNGLIFAFLAVGVLMLITNLLSRYFFKNKIPGVALAIGAALVLAYFGNQHGIADFSLFGGMALLGGAMFRDFTIVATSMGASFN